MAYWHLETSLHRIHRSRILRRPEGRIWVLRPIRLLKTSIKRLRPSRFFRCLGSTKWVRMAFRHHETMIHPLHQSRFLRRPEGRLWVLRALPLLKTSLKQHRPCRFFGTPGFRKYMAFRHVETTLHWLSKIVFQDFQKADYEFSVQFAYLKRLLGDFVQVVFSMFRKHKMSSHVLSTPWNMSSSTNSKVVF
jgi:hypothetical protein